MFYKYVFFCIDYALEVILLTRHCQLFQVHVKVDSEQFLETTVISILTTLSIIEYFSFELKIYTLHYSHCLLLNCSYFYVEKNDYI